MDGFIDSPSVMALATLTSLYVSVEEEDTQSNNSFVILADEPIDAGKHASLQTLDCFLSLDVLLKGCWKDPYRCTHPPSCCCSAL